MAACMMSWKLVLVAFATALIASSSCDSDCEGIYALTDNRCSYYSDLLENALLNDSDNVYLLQLVFFPSSGNTPREVGISVTITVGEIVSNGSCYMYDNCWPSTSSFSETGHYNIHLRWKKPHDSEDVPVKLFSNIAALGTFESVFCMIAPIVYYDYIYGHGGYSTYVSLELQLDQLPCNPCRDITYDTVAHIFTWAKAYARAHGKPETFDESDRGDISSTVSWYIKWDITNNFLLVGFVFLNVLVMLLMVRFVPDYYVRFVSRVNGDVNTRHMSRDVYLSLYWGCTVVLFFLAMALCLLDLFFYFLVLTPTLYWSSSFLTGIVVSTIFCISTKFVVVVLELIVCVMVHVYKKNTTAVDTPTPFQTSTESVLPVFCCYCCRCTCCSRNLKSKVVQTLALWGIMVFVQHITASLIPLCFALILTC